MTVTADVQQAAARADLFRLLSAGYYEPETGLMHEANYFDQLKNVVSSTWPELAGTVAGLKVSFAQAGQKQLLLDYARLFVGPDRLLAHPYGSIYLDRNTLLMGPSTVAVMALYVDNGLQVDDDFPETPDHIAVELEFLYLLSRREAEALQSSDRQLLASVYAARRKFLAEHLGRWVTPFARAVREQARTDYYRQLAVLTEAAVLNLEREIRQG